MSETHALYRFFDASGALLYIGITANPSERLRQHSKEKPWWHTITHISLECFPDKHSVLTAEREAILAEKPRHNIVHNRGGTTTPAVVLERVLPVQVGDWAALGLTTGECHVGEVAALDADWVSLRLCEFLMGTLTNRLVMTRWERIDTIEVAYLEDAVKDSLGLKMDSRHLSDFQTAWERAHDWGAHPLNIARRDVRMENAEQRAQWANR